MRKLFSMCLLVISFFFCIHIADILAQKPWTFLVYMAAANDLNSYALLDLQEMMKVGSHDNIDIIVYLTLQENDKQKVTQKLYINNGSMTQIGRDVVRDSGDVATLQEALEWACTDYPSDHMAVVMWSDGSGALNRSKTSTLSRGMCYDYDTGHYLTDCDCVQAFSWARDTLRGGKKFDIIAFDACFLASLEMAYTLSSCADYMVASEETIPFDGYQYSSLLEQFLTTNLDSLSFAQLMVSTYKQEYAKNMRYTLSVIDLNAVQELVDNCNAVAQFFIAQLNGKNQEFVRSAIKKCVNDCLSFDQGVYIDILQFYKNILKNIGRFKLWSSVAPQFKQMLNNGIKSFSTIIPAKVTSANYTQTGGLSLYFSRHAIDPSYYGLYWTDHNPQWLEFLETYIGVE